MTIVRYVECIDMEGKEEKYGPLWKKHTWEHVYYASLLAECLAETGRLRKCSRQLLPKTYRRLENYAYAVGLIAERGFIRRRRWGYGKLVEYTFYVYYEFGAEKNWRQLEVRVYTPFPLHEIALEEYWDVAQSFALRCVEKHYGKPFVESSIKEKRGVREVTASQGDRWCNKVMRVRLDQSIAVEITDYRGYLYKCTFRGGWSEWKSVARAL